MGLQELGYEQPSLLRGLPVPGDPLGHLPLAMSVALMQSGGYVTPSQPNIQLQQLSRKKSQRIVEQQGMSKDVLQKGLP